MTSMFVLLVVSMAAKKQWGLEKIKLISTHRILDLKVNIYEYLLVSFPTGSEVLCLHSWWRNFGSCPVSLETYELHCIFFLIFIKICITELNSSFSLWSVASSICFLPLRFLWSCFVENNDCSWMDLENIFRKINSDIYMCKSLI